jgi:murein DD-endopeptidase MepM/ murein hydrolase activator NlpD
MRALLGAVACCLLVTLCLTPGGSPAVAVEPVGVWPLDPDPEVVRGFEPPPAPYSSGHRGVDLAGAPGQPVRSALPGTVAFAGSIGGKPVVTVRHGGRRTTYEPVAATVEVGQEVTAGGVLGRLVVTDSHCFPAACLHWGLIVGSGDDERYADPLTLVGGGPVRLLPLWREEPATAPGWSPPLEVWRRPLDFLA